MESEFKRLIKKDFLKKVYDEAMAEDVASNAAQVAFYFIFALFPLLLFLLSVFGLVLGSAEDIRQELFMYLRQVVPASAIQLIETTLNEVVQQSSGGKLTLGFIVALWSASAGIDSVRIALNDIYDLTETRSWWKYKLTAVLITIAIAVLALISLGIIFYGSQIFASPSGDILMRVVGYVVVIGALILGFAVIYAFAPNHTNSTFRWITPGAVTAIILWIVFSLGFRLYLTYFDSYAKTYGSLGAIIILLLWLYLTALVILIGGVINAVGEKISAGKDAQIGKPDKDGDDEKADDGAEESKEK